MERMSRASSPSRSAVAQALPENENIDVEQLISLMHRRPPLWDKFDKKYHDRILKARLWEEIYQNLYFTWEQWSDTERKQKGADVQKKWKNLKDTFYKEVAADKKVVSGQATKKKKRPYIHMRALSFLATQKSFRDTTNNMRDTESTNNNIEDFTNFTDEDTDTEAAQNRRLKVRMRKKNRIQNNSDDEILKLLQDKKYDEDVSFCEMIIPMLKNLSIEQKHYAKIEILNALNRATKYSPENFMPPRASSTLSQYRPSSSSYSSFNPNTPSPCPNTIRQSPSPQISSYNSTNISQSQPDPSPQTQYTPSRKLTVISQSQPQLSSQTQYTPSRDSTVISQSQPDLSSQTQYTPPRNPTIIVQSQPDLSSETQYTPSRNSTVISQSQADPSIQTQYTPSRNPTVISQSHHDPSSTQYALSLNSNFPNTSFSHSSYVVEGSGFDMKDYILFK